MPGADLAVLVFKFDLDGEVFEIMLMEKIVELLLGVENVGAGGRAIHDEMGGEDVAFAIERPAVGVMT